MRSPLSLSLLLTFHSLVSISDAAPQPIHHRSPYSVVAVDGGAAEAAATGGPPPAVTIVLTETVTEKQPAATITIVDVQQKSASEITRTVTVSAPRGDESQREKETVYVTVEHVPTAINTAAGGPVIYVPTTITERIEVTLPAVTMRLVWSMTETGSSSRGTSASSSTTSAYSTSSSPSSFIPTVTSHFTSSKSSTTLASSSASTTAFSDTTSTGLTQPITSATESAQTSSSASTSTTPSPYDNGQWKTTYPIWQNSTIPTPAPQRIRR